MTSILVIYVLPTMALVAGYLFLKKRTSRRNFEEQEEARATGLHEPASLHPVIDQSRCIGCGSCVAACPEQSVLGLINGKAEPIAAANCIGHGACRTACPVSAITLVFGTATRGVDLPHVRPNFETNVAGLFIAGELGGMGLIRNAVEQGRQAVTYIRQSLPSVHGCELDLLIVGAGPSGISASLAAKQLGLRFLTIDQDSLGGTVSHFPRRKIVMTQPAQLPIVGKVRFRETTKEALLEFWQGVVARERLEIRHGERLENIERLPEGFGVVTTGRRYQARTVLLCLGRRGTPRRLDVPGEELTMVVYRLLDPEQYRGQSVLVVGGGDSAVEAAVSIAEEPDTQVALSYRGASFSRVKAKNRKRLEEAVAGQRLRLLLESRVSMIRERDVVLEQGAQSLELANDTVIVCAGGILPNALLESVGIALETKYGTV
jgi:thioredoxin reductase/Pyruvate/2-oxoacid:ferredoxin oxidoreductase delta subunit